MTVIFLLKHRVIQNDCRGLDNFLLHTLQVLYMCTLCDYTNINTIIEFVPYVSGDGFSGGSDSYLQFRDTCGKSRNINLNFDVTP